MPTSTGQTGAAIIKVMNFPAARLPSSGTPLAHRYRPPQQPRALASLDLLMASQPTAGIPCPFRGRNGLTCVDLLSFPASEYSRWHRVCLTVFACDVVMMYLFPCELPPMAGLKRHVGQRNRARLSWLFGGTAAGTGSGEPRQRH